MSIYNYDIFQFVKFSVRGTKLNNGKKTEINFILILNKIESSMLH